MEREEVALFRSGTLPGESEVDHLGPDDLFGDECQEADYQSMVDFRKLNSRLKDQNS